MRHTCVGVRDITSLEISFNYYLEKVVLGNLKSFFQFDQQDDISLYLMEATALHHSRELASLTPP